MIYSFISIGLELVSSPFFGFWSTLQSNECHHRFQRAKIYFSAHRWKLSTEIEVSYYSFLILNLIMILTYRKLPKTVWGSGLGGLQNRHWYWKHPFEHTLWVIPFEYYKKCDVLCGVYFLYRTKSSMSYEWKMGNSEDLWESYLMNFDELGAVGGTPHYAA